MLADLIALLWAPFLMCLVLTGIHAYLGIHVIAREVIFVDIAMAQIAALGATAAFLAGFELESPVSYASGLGFTLLGAVVLALTRSRKRHISQEAVIGVVYAVSAAAAVLLADRSPHGAEHVRVMLVGNILTVGGTDVARVVVLYALVGVLHWLCRRPFLLISTEPEAAFREGWRVRWWDLLFYATFGVVVARLVVGWVFGAAVSLIGIVGSAALDLPTGATVVCAFGLALVILRALAAGVRSGARRRPAPTA
jgi:zinc/manganese transport system permease protein